LLLSDLLASATLRRPDDLQAKTESGYGRDRGVGSGCAQSSDTLLRLMPLRCDHGASLLELLIAVVMVSAIVAMISLFFPRASKPITDNRHRWFASNFASTHIQELKQQPYPLVPLTPQADFGATPNCDCSAVDLSTLPVDAIYSEAGVSYTRRVCINLV